MLLVLLSARLTTHAVDHPGPRADSYQTNTPWSDPGFFPIGVWLQDPANAAHYKQAGFNLYVGLWDGPTEAQLSALKQAQIFVVCEQNAVGLRHLDDTNLIGWMHGDEPDNAQSLGARLGFGAPIPPAKVVEEYHRIKAADPVRPVLLNLGQGVAWDGWYGRGARTGHPEDYPEYVKGGDIASFDIYPAVHGSQAVSGKLWFVADGVDRLVDWAGTNRLVWNCLECTHIENPARKATPHQVRCEAWMSLIHGSRGLIYFVHQFKPVFREAALLDDAEMLGAVTTLNHEIASLAPVLNSPTLEDVATIQSANASVPVSFVVKHHAGATYLFAVAMRPGETDARFALKGIAGKKSVEALGEDRTLAMQDGSFSDHFGEWDVHLYRIR